MRGMWVGYYYLNIIKTTYMNFNNFTIKSQEAIQKAVEITRAAGTQAIEPVCLLKGVMDEGETVVNFIFQKIGANASAYSGRSKPKYPPCPKCRGKNHT